MGKPAPKKPAAKPKRPTHLQPGSLAAIRTDGGRDLPAERRAEARNNPPTRRTDPGYRPVFPGPKMPFPKPPQRKSGKPSGKPAQRKAAKPPQKRRG